MRVTILLNSAAGTAAAMQADLLLQRFAGAGVPSQVRSGQGEALAAAAREAAAEKPDVLVAAGGDGTVNAVAAALVNSPIALGVVPLGTLNHFARDIGVGPDLDLAVRVIADGHVQNLDVVQVNGQTFINNSSIGLYPRLVSHRHQQQRLGRGRWVAMLLAALAVFRRYPLVEVNVQAEGRVFPRLTPFVFIGNNPYEMHLLALGIRRHLDSGQLGVYFANRTGRFGLFRLMLRALVGRLNQAKDFDILLAREVRIDAPRHRVRVALDGEVRMLSPPLHYRVLPGALKVLTPRHRGLSE